jgi:hypothetical protein
MGYPHDGMARQPLGADKMGKCGVRFGRYPPPKPNTTIQFLQHMLAPQALRILFIDIIFDMSVKAMRRMVGILILLLSLALLIWAFWPIEQINLTVPIPLQNMQMPTPAGLILALWFL